MHTPNTKLYVKLSIIFGLSTVLLFILLAIFCANNVAVIFISCLISVLGGIFASIVVSWLIDVSSCKKNNSAIKLKKDKNLEYVKLFLDNLFESFADACQDVDHQEQGNWEYWLMTMNENDFFRNNPAFYDVCLGIYVHLNSIINLLDEANSGELKEYYLATACDLFFELQILKTACENLRDLIFLNSNQQHIEHIVFQFKDVLSTVLAFSDLASKNYKTIGKDNLNV